MFRSARESQGLSQTQVARLTEGLPGQIPRTTISDIECGRNLPSVEALLSLSRVLHLDPLEILERVDLHLKVPIDLGGFSLAELCKRGDTLFWDGDYRSALATYDAAFERIVREPPDNSEQRTRLLAKIEISRATTLRQCSAVRAAKATAERATEIARPIPELRAEAYMVLASLHSHEGLLGLALDALERASALSDSGNAKLRGQIQSQKGAVLYRAGRYNEARLAYLHARKDARAAGDHHGQILVEGGLGACLAELGLRERARSGIAQAVRLARKHADPEAEAMWLVGLGRLYLEDELFEEADRHARHALRIAKPSNRTLTVFRAEWIRHQVVRRTDPEDADERRLQILNKLYLRVKEHRGLDEVREFKEAVLNREDEERSDA